MKNKFLYLIAAIVLASFTASGFYISQYISHQEDVAQLKKMDAIIDKEIADMEAAAKEASANAEENTYTDGDATNDDTSIFSLFDAEDADINFLLSDEVAENLMSGEKVSIGDVKEYAPTSEEPSVEDGYKVVSIDLTIENIGTPATEISSEDFSLTTFDGVYDRYGSGAFVEKFKDGITANHTLFYVVPEDHMSFDLHYVSHDEAQTIDSGLTRLYSFAVALPLEQ